MRVVVVCTGPHLRYGTKVATSQTAPDLDEGLWSIMHMFCIATEDLGAPGAELEDTAR